MKMCEKQFVIKTIQNSKSHFKPLVWHKYSKNMLENRRNNGQTAAENDYVFHELTVATKYCYFVYDISSDYGTCKLLTVLAHKL